MTRSDLVEALSKQFGQLAHRDAEFAVKAILDAMGDALVKGHRIEIRGFGSFAVNRRSPRVGRNPRTGEAIPIKARNVVTFHASAKLKGLVQGDAADGEDLE